MAANLNIVLTASKCSHANLRTEICEHKGIGHPDSICDGVAEAVSRALCSAYINSYGEVRHHNVDKALLIGGQSVPKFGGGRIEMPMRLIVAGRADPLPGSHDIGDLVCAAARDYIASNLRCSTGLFNIESVVRLGSANLRRVVVPTAISVPLANDTSIGVGFAPYSKLEQLTLNVAALITSAAFRTMFPMAGDDFKVMAMRQDDSVSLTIALAIIDRAVQNAAQYFSLKAAIAKWLVDSIEEPCDIRINTLDDSDAHDESGIYLTVTGLSAEHGDDGQVGRGNRVTGLITPSRPMSLEAAAGKNPISHVGKIYNVLAFHIAHDLVAQIPAIHEAIVQILSNIGQPIDCPRIVDIQILSDDLSLNERISQQAKEIVTEHFTRIELLTKQLARGELRVF